MSTPIFLRLLCGDAPVLRALVLGLVSFGVLVFVDQGRSWTMPIADPSALALAREGSVAFLAAGLLGAILAGAFWEVRVCPFAWNVPGLARRAAFELRFAGVITITVAAVIGALTPGGDGHPLLPAIAGAAGFAVGVFNLDPPTGWNRPWQLPAMLAAVLPVYFMAEIALVSERAPWIWLAFAAAIMFAAIECNGAASARRARHRLDRSAWPVERAGGLDGAAAHRLRRAPRDGADAFSGVRRSDGAWARAFLHETVGPVRGGMIGQAIGSALATLGVCVLVNLYFAANLSGGGTAGSTGAALSEHTVISAPLGEAVSERLGRGQIFGAVFPVALVLSMFTLGSPVLPRLSVVHPLSRPRRARILWLMTQQQEGLILLALLAVFAAATALASVLTMHDWWRMGGLWMLAAVAGWVVLPLGRWVRLGLVDADGVVSTATMLDVRTPRFILAACANAVAVVGGAFLVFSLWRASRELPDVGRVLVAIASIAAIAALRWLWLVILVRYHARADLPAS